ncbi:MAG: hypothetical protein M5T61_10220 [Acidimicrobiia bacterium]|nr:hypothetical protein [Acidimicrobiia bacterium]
MPAGTEKPNLWATWRNLIWSRAVENLAIVVTTQNLFRPTQLGLAMVAGPEGILFESVAAGTFIIDVDLARIRELRAMRDGAGSTNGAKAGVLTSGSAPICTTRSSLGRRSRAESRGPRLAGDRRPLARRRARGAGTRQPDAHAPRRADGLLRLGGHASAPT